MDIPVNELEQVSNTRLVTKKRCTNAVFTAIVLSCCVIPTPLVLADPTVNTLSSAPVKPQQKPSNNSLSFATNYYLDDRGHNTLSLIYSSKSLPYGLAFWGFTDLDSNQDNEDSRSDMTRYFTEARLTKMFGGGWGVQAEYNDASGTGNNLGRFGVVYKFPLDNRFVMLRVFPVETDGDGGQVSLIWRTKIGLDNLFFEGFIDYNIKEGQTNRIVSEPQLRYRVSDRLGITLEYRINEFLKPTPKDHKGTALGLYYKF
ncbi:MAG: hypothetical protein V3T17_14720 [Pseudomonadales bacterium]